MTTGTQDQIDGLNRRVIAIEHRLGIGSGPVEVTAPKPKITTPKPKLNVYCGVLGDAGKKLAADLKLPYLSQYHPTDIGTNPKIPMELRFNLRRVIEECEEPGDAYDAGHEWGKKMVKRGPGYVDELRVSELATGPHGVFHLAKGEQDEVFASKMLAFHVGMADGESEGTGIGTDIGFDCGILSPIPDWKMRLWMDDAQRFAKTPSWFFTLYPWMYRNRGNAGNYSEVVEQWDGALTVLTAFYKHVKLRPTFRAFSGLKLPVEDEFDALVEAAGRHNINTFMLWGKPEDETMTRDLLVNHVAKKYEIE